MDVLLLIQHLLQDNILKTLLLIPLVVIGLDVLTGVMSAVKHGTFQLKYFSDFLGQDVLKYIAAVAFVLIVWVISGSAVAVATAETVSLGTLALPILASIAENLGELKEPVVSMAVDEVEQAVGITSASSSPITPPTAPSLMPVVRVANMPKRDIADHPTQEVSVVPPVIVSSTPLPPFTLPDGLNVPQ